jgi:GAG-pre-integrase domain
MLEQVRMLTEENGESWMTEERQDGIVGAYLARADALELLHIRLGHMPYQRIERMIRRQIIKEYKLDSKTLKAVLRERCDVCICSKKVDALHKSQLPLPKTAWVSFSTDLSAVID